MTELLIVLTAIALGAFVKGVTGVGLPQVAIPVMATFVGVEHAVVVMAIPGIVSNSWLMWRNRAGFGSTRDLPVLLVTGTIGAVIGTWFLKELDAAVLNLTLAAIILGYVVLAFARPNFRLSPRTTRIASPPVGLAAGVLQGATGISGPLVTTYVHGYRLDSRVYVVTIVTVFQVFAVVQTVVLGAVGLYTAERLVQSLSTLLPMAVFLVVGARVTDRLPARTFDRLVLLLLVGSAAKLGYDGMVAL